MLVIRCDVSLDGCCYLRSRNSRCGSRYIDMFLWSAKVSPFEQINGDQLRNLTLELIRHCERNGSKIHSGTFVLCTGECNQGKHANANCPGPVATFIEKVYIFLAFIIWVICNCWKTPFFLHGYCSGLCMDNKDWRRTRRQIQRVEQLEKERVAFNKLTAKKRKLKRLQTTEQQNYLDNVEKGFSAGESKAESF